MIVAFDSVIGVEILFVLLQKISKMRGITGAG